MAKSASAVQATGNDSHVQALGDRDPDPVPAPQPPTPVDPNNGPPSRGDGDDLSAS
jgi:hypothetical protein